MHAIPSGTSEAFRSCLKVIDTFRRLLYEDILSDC